MKEYFVPEIEDIKIGYECEHTTNMSAFEINDTDRIIKDKLYLPDVVSYLSWVLEDGEELSKFIRTPYLTKEQIEKEGWEPLSDKSPFTGKEYKWRKIIGEKETGVFNEDHIYTLEYYPYNASPQLTIHLEWESSWNRYDGNIYVGKCPSINEFRYITKLLNI